MVDVTNSQRVPNHGRWVDHYITHVDQDFHQPMDTDEKQYATQEDANSAE
jgi:hypothetical protein